MSKIIKINTSAILEYSAQLQDVEKRLKIIHKKMPQYIINGSLSGEINEVKVCSKVLWQIAENFEQVERQLFQAVLLQSSSNNENTLFQRCCNWILQQNCNKFVCNNA